MMPSSSRAKSGSQSEPHSSLITFQPAPANRPSSSCTMEPLPRTGPSRRCRLQLTTKMRLSRPSRAASDRPASDSGSSISPSPTKAHTLRPARVEDAAVLEVAHEARLVDGVDRAEAHRAGGELPEVRHQPGMGVRRQPLAADLAPVVRELLLGQPAFEKGARIHARRRVRLEVDEVARSGRRGRSG